MSKPINPDLLESYHQYVKGLSAPYTDWRNFIELYREGYFNVPQYGELLRKHYRSEAGNWVTCAVGNQCAIIPRNDKHRPLDAELYELGDQFYKAVHDLLCYKRAAARLRRVENVLDKIEARSAILIAQELSRE